MSLASVASKGMHYLRFGLATLATFQFAIAAPFADAASKPQTHKTIAPATATPIQACHRDHRRESQLRPRLRHLPNRRADRPSTTCFRKASSRWTANKNAIPGPNFIRRNSWRLPIPTDVSPDPPKQQFPSNVLPAPLVGGPSGAHGYFSGSNPCNTTPLLPALQCAAAFGKRIARR